MQTNEVLVKLPTENDVSDFEFIQFEYHVAIKKVTTNEIKILPCGADLRDYCHYLTIRNRVELANNLCNEAFDGKKPISALIENARKEFIF